MVVFGIKPKNIGCGLELSVEYLGFPEGSAGRKAALEFLKQRYADITALNRTWGTDISSWDKLNGREGVSGDMFQKDQTAWQEVVARRYFATCRKAIYKADPNHLVLGCRFAGHAPAPVLRGLRDYVDVCLGIHKLCLA